MRKFRVIPRLDIKGPNLIKGIQMEGLRVLGDPADFSRKYYREKADELIYMDSVASLYERNNILGIVKKTAEDIFIPMTVGGGIRSIQDVQAALCSGADKVAVNTAAIKHPRLIAQIVEHFGSQCMVLSVEAKAIASGVWEVYIDNGRERTGLDVIEWVQQAQDLGVGEILLTSIDRDGTKKGFDIDLANAVTQVTSVPIIVSGGMGKLTDLVDLLEQTDVDAAAIASVLHYKMLSLDDIYRQLLQMNIEVRV